MWIVRLLLSACLLALLAPTPAAAAPLAEEECRLSSRIPAHVREALIDAGVWLAALDEAQVQLGGQQITLRICAPAEERGTARRMLQLLQQALPLLDRSAGLPYDGAVVRDILLVPTPEMAEVHADGFVRRDGVMVLHPRSAEWTVIHEAAHYWAHSESLAEPWMWEGYADYLTELTLADLGLPLVPLMPETGCEGHALVHWRRDPHIPPYCGYRVGARVFRELSAAVGHQPIATALRQLGDGISRANSWRLLAALELATGRDLTPIFRAYVLPPEASDWLDRWSRTQALLREVRAISDSLGLSLPQPILLSVQNWRSGILIDREIEGARALLAALLPALERARYLDERCGALGLGCAGRVGQLPSDLAGAQQLDARLAAEIDLLSSFEQLAGEAAAAGLPLAQRARDAAEALDTAASERFRRALSLLQRGRAIDEGCAAASAPCGSAWHTAWENFDLDGMEREISGLEWLLPAAGRVEQSCGELGRACREIWHAALRAGGVSEAQLALEQIEALLKDSAAANGACQALQVDCQPAWETPLRAGDLEGARQNLDGVLGLRQRAEEVTRRCDALGMDCRPLWLDDLQSGKIDAAGQTLAEIAALLPEAERVTAVCQSTLPDCRPFWRGELERRRYDDALEALRRLEQFVAELQALEAVRAPRDVYSELVFRVARVDPPALIGAAKEAAERGETDRAQELIEQAWRLHERAHLLRRWAPAGLALAGLGVALALGVFLWRRRAALALGAARWRRRPPPSPRRPQATGRRQQPDDLLAELLARPPGGANE